jgi:pyridoxine kinase
MFAALTIPRLIEAVHSVPDLSSTPSWRSPDSVAPQDLPLAKACQKVLASMQSILAQTSESCKEKMEVYDRSVEREGCGEGKEVADEAMRKRHLRLMDASEVKVPRFVRELVRPGDLGRFEARAVEPDDGRKERDGEKQGGS